LLTICAKYSTAGPKSSKKKNRPPADRRIQNAAFGTKPRAAGAARTDPGVKDHFRRGGNAAGDGDFGELHGDLCFSHSLPCHPGSSSAMKRETQPASLAFSRRFFAAARPQAPCFADGPEPPILRGKHHRLKRARFNAENRESRYRIDQAELIELSQRVESLAMLLP
jgi:hypothetical protein